MYDKPKKSLGQNFLFDKNIQRKIITVCELKNSDIVLEIGAGTGELTKLIAGCVKAVYALEIDRSLCRILKENLKMYPNVKVINQDILKFNFQKYFKESKNRVKVIGNIPYYISSPILEHLLKFRHKIEVIFIMLQKELGKRITACAGAKEYSSFSCFLQYYTKAQTLFFIRNTCFFPKPKVDSSFMRLDIRESPTVETKNEKLLFKIIRAAFNKRRKILRNSLKGVISYKKIEAFFNKYGILRNIRPEELDLQDFSNLANI